MLQGESGREESNQPNFDSLFLIGTVVPINAPELRNFQTKKILRIEVADV